MKYFTEGELRRYERRHPDIRSENRIRKDKAKTTIFLSHSHKDADLIQAAIAFLLDQGVLIYVDWLDPLMTSITTSGTALRIKNKIKENEKFIVLLSSNAKESKWVPWELGYADGVKKVGRVAILPILRSSQDSFNGVEYMELYPKINLEEFGSYTHPVIEKDTSKANPRSLKEGWIDRSIVIF